MEVWIKDAWDWLGKEVVEFGFRWAVAAMFALAFGGWFGKRYRDMKRDVTELKSELRERREQPPPSVQINLAPGATYNDFRGVDGEFHVGLDGKAEVISLTPVDVVIGAVGIPAPTATVAVQIVNVEPPGDPPSRQTNPRAAITDGDGGNSTEE